MLARRHHLVAAVLVTAVVAAGCGDSGDPGRVGVAEPAVGVDRSGDIEAIVDDLNDYWSRAGTELGFDYEPIPPDRVTDGSDGVTCDARPIDPADIEGNAFVDPGCAEGITVAYDPDYLDDSLARAEATLAHEWGHVIQAQAVELDLSEDPDGLPIDAELQADCFAGAWAAERAEADIERLRRDTAGAGDPDEVDLDDPHAHGTPFERAEAFDVGLDGGPAACIDELIDALPG